MTAAKKSIGILLALAMFGAAGAMAQGVRFQVIQPAGYKPAGLPFSPGILAGNTLYVSGAGPDEANGQVPATIEGQVKQTLRNVRAVLEAAGMNYGNIAWMNIYLTRASDIAAMNRAYWQEIGPNPPARTVLVIGALAGQGARVEINCIAVKSSVPRRVIWPQGWRRARDMDPPGIEAGDVLYMSAQSGANPKTGVVPSSFPDEVRQALENVSAITAAAGMSMKNVLWVNPYMTSGGYDVMGNVYKTFFQFGNTPGRGTFYVVGLPHQVRIVFSCIAGADLAKRKAIRPLNEPPSPTASPGILYGDTLYLSAKDAYVPALGIISPDLGVQMRLSMRNLLDGLQKAGMTFSDVVFARVYLRNMKDYGAMNNIYKSFLGPVFPARTTIQQNDDFTAEDAEQISFIAVRNKAVHNIYSSK